MTCRCHDDINKIMWGRSPHNPQVNKPLNRGPYLLNARLYNTRGVYTRGVANIAEYRLAELRLAEYKLAENCHTLNLKINLKKFDKVWQIF